MTSTPRRAKIRCSACGEPIIIERHQLRGKLACGDCDAPIVIELYPRLAALRDEVLAADKLEREAAEQYERQQREAKGVTVPTSSTSVPSDSGRPVGREHPVAVPQLNTAPQPVALRQISLLTAVKIGFGVAIGMALFSVAVVVTAFIFATILSALGFMMMR